jgi:hypothetical protein
MAAFASLGLSIIGIPLYVLENPPEVKAAVGMGMFGLTLLRGLVAYGAWYRTRWAAWVGALLALVSVLAPFVEMPAQGESPLTLPLLWLDTLANAAFLIGLGMLLSGRRSPGERPGG